MTIEGSIEAIGVSGRHWIGEGELDAFDLFRETLKSAKSSIRIAVFSLGWKSKELDSIFEILKNKIVTGVEVQLIINKFWSTADYGKKKLKDPQIFHCRNTVYCAHYQYSILPEHDKHLQ